MNHLGLATAEWLARAEAQLLIPAEERHPNLTDKVLRAGVAVLQARLAAERRIQ